MHIYKVYTEMLYKCNILIINILKIGGGYFVKYTHTNSAYMEAFDQFDRTLPFVFSVN